MGAQRRNHSHRDFAAMVRALTPGQGHPGELERGQWSQPIGLGCGNMFLSSLWPRSPPLCAETRIRCSLGRVNVRKRAHGGDEEGAGQDDTPPQSTTGIPALRCEGKPHVLGHPGRLADSDSELLPSETRNGMTPCRKPHAVCTRRRDFLTASAPDVSPTGKRNGRKDPRQKPRGVCTHGTSYLASRGSGGTTLPKTPRRVYTWGALSDRSEVPMRLRQG